MATTTILPPKQRHQNIQTRAQPKKHQPVVQLGTIKRSRSEISSDPSIAYNGETEQSQYIVTGAINMARMVMEAIVENITGDKESTESIDSLTGNNTEGFSDKTKVIFRR